MAGRVAHLAETLGPEDCYPRVGRLTVKVPMFGVPGFVARVFEAQAFAVQAAGCWAADVLEKAPGHPVEVESQVGFRAGFRVRCQVPSPLWAVRLSRCPVRRSAVVEPARQ